MQGGLGEEGTPLWGSSLVQFEIRCCVVAKRALTSSRSSVHSSLTCSACDTENVCGGRAPIPTLATLACAVLTTQALEAADMLLLTREAIQGVARKHQMVACFAPKYSSAAGNACPCHLSLWKVRPQQATPAEVVVSALGDARATSASGRCVLRSCRVRRPSSRTPPMRAARACAGHFASSQLA